MLSCGNQQWTTLVTWAWNKQFVDMKISSAPKWRYMHRKKTHRNLLLSSNTTLREVGKREPVKCCVFREFLNSSKYRGCVRSPPPTRGCADTHSKCTPQSHGEIHEPQVQPFGNSANWTSTSFWGFSGEWISPWCCREMQRNWWLLFAVVPLL